MPEAQLDRFMLKLHIGYPQKSEERQILDLMATSAPNLTVMPVVDPQQIIAARSVVNEIYIDDRVKDYIVDVVWATRDPASYNLKLDGLIRYGASPRATIYLALAARAHAFLNGRGYVTPQDVKSIGTDVLRHRVIVSYEAEAETITSETIVDRIFRRPARPVIAQDRQTPAEILKKIRALEIKTKGLVQTMFAGDYHSVFKGRGMNFEDVREYQPGDEIRAIDWNVTARLGTAFVKKFTEERELTVVLVVDVSASGNFGSASQSKRELAAEIACLLAFSAIRNNDKVGLLLFSDTVELFIPPKKGRSHTLRIIREILFFEPAGRGTAPALALDYLNKVVTRRAVVFFISDFQTSDFSRELSVSGRRHDFIAVHIQDQREEHLPNVGIITLEDAETGEQIEINTADRNTRALQRLGGDATGRFEPDAPPQQHRRHFIAHERELSARLALVFQTTGTTPRRAMNWLTYVSFRRRRHS